MPMKISIMVPIYGVAQYIEECLVSLFEQTYADLEYIFVDDCSPDNSMTLLEQVAERYPQRQSQIHVLHHDHNRGLGAARATALQAATGDFVMIVDSDDVLPTDAVTKLWKQQQISGADMVDGAFCQLTSSGLSSPILPYHGPKEKMLRLMLLQNVVFHQLWGRLIRRSIFTDYDIHPIEGVNMAEDYAVTPRLLYCCNRSSIDDIVYYYRINEQSTFADNLTNRHIVSFLKANGAVYQFIIAHDLTKQYHKPLQIGMLRVYHAALSTGMNRKDISQLCGYRLPLWLHPFCFRPMLPMLRLLYLVTKRLYTFV